MRTLPLAACVVLFNCQTELTDDVPIACNAAALTTTERTESLALQKQLFAAVIHRDEQRDGFVLEIDEQRVAFGSLARWVELERRCCPFLEFAIVVERNHAATRLYLRGSPAAKELIRGEIMTG